ncbi:MAG: hypothetical protein QOG20_173 [Pseudonocardiales bacterium]|jgi:hypothetical protein|nr:hypothetical protein [Pseudonocardiales bacterium]
MSAPNYPQAPVPAPPVRKQKGRGLAVSALVLGIIALVFSWVPILNIVGIVVGVIGLILGIVGIFISHRVMAIIGAVLALLGIIVAINVNSAVAKAITAPTTVQEQNGPAAAGAADTYEYQVTGSGQATVGYGTVSGSGVTSSSGTQALPWSKTITVDNKGIFFAPTLTATAMSGGSVACKIIHNGKVVADQTASGQYATVSCSGS